MEAEDENTKQLAVLKKYTAMINLGTKERRKRDVDC